MSDYDILIVGGGLVGASLACALRGRGLRLAIVEARPANASPDPRRLAIAYSSRCILDTLQVWPTAAACPIQTVHVSQQGSLGQVQLRHSDIGVPALGYMVAAHDLDQALWQTLNHSADIARLRPVTLEQIHIADTASLELTLQRPDGTQQTVSTRLLVAADGGRSSIRERLNIPALRHDYHQAALLADVTLNRPHNHTAYERFTPAGAVALLPMAQQQATLVHTVAQHRLESLLALDDAGFAQYISAAFNGRLAPDLVYSPRLSYPLHLLKAQWQVGWRTVLIGNAAHTLHPLAGQGFNLGLRDAAVLAEHLAAAQSAGLDIGSPAILNRYASERDADHRASVAFTDGLVHLFGLPQGPIRMARSLGLGLLALMPPARRVLTRQMMGLNGRQSRLARNLPLAPPARGDY